MEEKDKQEILDKVYSEWFTHGQWKVVSEFFKNNLILRGAELRTEQIVQIIKDFNITADTDLEREAIKLKIIHKINKGK